MDKVYNKTRLTLFVHSYGWYFITTQLKNSHQTNEKLVLEIENLARVLNFNTELLWRSMILDRKPRRFLKLEVLKDDKEKILTYLKIENEISELVLKKEDKDSLFTHDYERAIVEPAIERVAGNKLSDVDDDIEFETKLEELKRNYRNLYYKVAYMYKLPTIRILPFILRLITL